VAPLTGVAFVVLVVAAFIVGGESPGTDDSVAEIVDYYKDKEGRTFLATALLAWGAIAFVFFVGVLRNVLRSAGEATAWLSAVAFGGGLIAAAGMLSFAGFGFALADTADTASPVATQAVHILSSDFFFLLAGGIAVLLIATGITVIRSGVLPVWLGWVALLLGIAAATPGGFFAFLLFLVWTLIVSVMLWRAAPAASPPPAAAPTQPNI
jgi:hypothetical protein